MAIIFNSLPVKPLRITSYYGKRNTNISGASTFHEGIDLGYNKSLSQTPILSVVSGTVSDNYWNDYRGWVIVINHGEFKTLYQHLKSQSPLKKGDKVTTGQQIGIMGDSSNPNKLNISTHLHFELIYNNESINPLYYLRNIKEVEDLTREETIALIKEILASQDVKASDWAKKYWTQATSEGLVDGTRPRGYLTREEMVKVLLTERSKRK